MIVQITISMFDGVTLPIDIEMITDKATCEQEIKDFNPVKMNFVGNIVSVKASCQPLPEEYKDAIIIENDLEGVDI